MSAKVKCQDCGMWSLQRVRKGFRICLAKNHFIDPANQPRFCRKFIRVVIEQ